MKKEEKSNYKYFTIQESLDAVKRNGLELEFVKNQTPEICLEAVKEDPWALEYVHEQTHELCLIAVKEDGHALKCVKEQTPELCLEAVIDSNSALKYINDPKIKESVENFIKRSDKKMEENKVLFQSFYNFLSDLETLVNNLELDFKGSSDEPDYENLLINMSFDIHDENKIEQLIRLIRDNMTNNFPTLIEPQPAKYPLAVNKSYIISSGLWSVEVYYSKKWKLREDTQP